MSTQALASQPILSLATSLQRARCQRPPFIERMVKSLSAHGQLTPIVTTEQEGKLQIVDGFKRLTAARRLGWDALTITTKPLDQTSQWAVMLALNRSPGALTELDEAFILRELARQGLKQTEIAELVQRHKTWVSRRLGLLERLHPELVEGMKVGVLHPGVARRLLSLPQGNQLPLCTAAQNAGLGPRDTEALVSLWHKAKDSATREYLLAEPRQALTHTRPELTAPDPRLTLKGQQLQRCLSIVVGVTSRLTPLWPPTEEDLQLLAKPVETTRATLSRLATLLGSRVSDGDKSASGDCAGESSSEP